MVILRGTGGFAGPHGHPTFSGSVATGAGIYCGRVAVAPDTGRGAAGMAAPRPAARAARDSVGLLGPRCSSDPAPVDSGTFPALAPVDDLSRPQKLAPPGG